MSLPATIQAVILDTILARLIPLFLIGANADPEAARHAAIQLLADYNPQTDQELILAAESISHSLHCLEALSQSMDPELPLTRKIRLRSSAVSLNRESHRSRQKLDQLQRARSQPGLRPAEPALPQAPQQPAPELIPPDLITLAQEAIQIAAKQPKQGKYGGLTYAQDLQRRMTARRIAEKASRKAAEDRARMARAGQPQNGLPETGQPLPGHSPTAQPQALTTKPQAEQHATVA